MSTRVRADFDILTSAKKLSGWFCRCFNAVGADFFFAVGEEVASGLPGAFLAHRLVIATLPQSRSHHRIMAGPLGVAINDRKARCDDCGVGIRL